MKPKKENPNKNLTYLSSQSNMKYALLKDEVTKLYYICRIKDKKQALIGDRDKAELFVLYGIEANKQDLTTLNFI